MVNTKPGKLYNFRFYFKIKKKMIKIRATNNRFNKILQEKHGDLMFYQAGGYCEGRSPSVLRKLIREWEMCIGTIEGTEFWVDKDLFEYWSILL
jgi:uncharacterized protein (DUF779 family)